VEVIQEHFVQQGVWIRPFMNRIYMMPPYISEEQHIDKLISAISSALEKYVCFQ
jgi:adenosylmethionine-8-amino-7-oxononanoate aminotransferase